MPRIRSVKPELWGDQELAERVSRDARLAYVGLWNLADEWGRLRGDARHIKGQLFAYDDDLTPNDVDALVNELVAAKKVVRYFAMGAVFLFLPNLHKHQRLEPQKVPSRLPAPPEIDDAEPALFDVASAQIRADESARRPADLRLAGGMEHGAGGARRQVRADPAPPRYCPEHPTGTTRRCRPCGDARKAFQAWEAERRTRQANAPPCTTHPHELASNCRLCAAERKGRPDRPNRPEGTEQ